MFISQDLKITKNFISHPKINIEILFFQTGIWENLTFGILIGRKHNLDMSLVPQPAFPTRETPKNVPETFSDSPNTYFCGSPELPCWQKSLKGFFGQSGD